MQPKAPRKKKVAKIGAGLKRLVTPEKLLKVPKEEKISDNESNLSNDNLEILPSVQFLKKPTSAVKN
mgnify:CR=1 FL=1